MNVSTADICESFQVDATKMEHTAALRARWFDILRGMRFEDYCWEKISATGVPWSYGVLLDALECAR